MNKCEKEKGVPRNYENPEPLNTSHKDKSVTVTMIGGRTESGILRKVGQFWIELEMSNKRSLVINKGSILTVSVL